jgi:predicted ferric reductase
MAAPAVPKRIDPQALRRKLKLRSDYLAERLAAALEHYVGNATGDAALDQALTRARDGSLDDKVALLFWLHDADGSGMIEREELERLIHIALAETNLKLPPDVADRLGEALWSAAETNHDGRVSIEELLDLIRSRPALREQLVAFGSGLLAPRTPTRRRGGYNRNRALVAAFVTLYALINVALFARAWIHYGHAGASVAVQLARGCGACLNFNGALLLVPMLRHALTWVRRRPAGRFIPVDDAIDAHRLIAEVLFGFSLVHSGAHITNIVLTGASWTSRANVTGYILLWGLLVMWLMSRRRVRQSGQFEAFHFTHRVLWWGWFGVALVHGPVFWIWTMVPLGMFIVELGLRAVRKGAAAPLSAARPLPSGVTQLVFERPENFNEQAGDYVFINIPAISRHEWHPFTLTSAPELPHLSVHIRSLGDWTTTVHERFMVWRDAKGMPVHVDGPYGTPTFHLPQSVHAVAIAAGIGVTPFASLLQSIAARRRAGDSLALRRLHFIWLSSEAESFEWFSELLTRLDDEDEADLFDIHIHLTGSRADMEGTTLELARALLLEQTGHDLVTGLAVRTKLGRPDFDALFDRFCAEPDLPRPDVYFCGPPGLARALEAQCATRKLRFRHERF